MINELLCGDCLELLKSIPEVDLVVTDPPYKFESQGGGFYAKCKSTKRIYAKEIIE